VKVSSVPGAPELSVVGFIARLNAAVISLLPPAAPVVLVVTRRSPLTGLDEVTVGTVAPAAAVHVAPGMIGVGVAVAAAVVLELGAGAPPPPPPLPHATKKALSNNAVNCIRDFESL